jgi:hypothetical protein
MREIKMRCRLALPIAKAAGIALVLALFAAPAKSAEPVKVDQGELWTAAEQKDYYSRDQGSRLIPYAWISALKQPDGKPFLAESLARYGYLPNPASVPPGLPVGFVVAAQGGTKTLGLTCSACHTRQIEVGGKEYRIDGGPAIADLGAFWADLDAAFGKALADPVAFEEFAQSVLGPSPTPAEAAALRQEAQAWYKGFHAITERGLPKRKPWGPGRLDAVGMILNRVAGLDIGPAPDFLIEENIKLADAPVRPPFLWNAPLQDKTQWPGFADNGDWLLALVRNLGQVYGVFGVVHPIKDPAHLLGFDYNNDSTAQFTGLEALEGIIGKIGAPKWPWPVDQKLAAAGKEIFDRPTDKGGCIDCHGVRPGEPRLFNEHTWATPVQDVGTDSREYLGLARVVKTGALEGAQIPTPTPPFLDPPLKAQDKAVAVLATATQGAVAQHVLPVFVTPQQREQVNLILKVLGPQLGALQGAFHTEEVTKAAPEFKYESRVMEGVWAAAPYLHNASVPTLADLLKPASERPKAFKVGPRYDIENVGLAVEQDKFGYTLKTTDCGDRSSGDSRCGHEFGTTTLTPDEKKALLEYLKTL